MTSRGVKKMSAGPPACQDVCFAIDTSCSTRLVNSGDELKGVAARSCRGPEAALQILSHRADVAGAHGQHHVAVMHHGAQRLGKIIDAARRTPAPP